MNTLVPYIWVAGVVHLLITSVNFFLPKKLGYRENLPKLPSLMRQIYVVHSVYIGLVLLGLAGLCLFFAPELAGASRLGRALSGFLAVFWGLRVCIQRFYYDPESKRQNRAMDVLFTVAFVYLTGVFGVAALGVVP